MSMAYATAADVAAGFRTLDSDETTKCNALLEEAATIIDAYAQSAANDVKKLVSCHMVRRALGDGSSAAGVPIGATQGSMSALGYSQSWTLSNGAVGELYFTRLDKRLLGISGRIGAHSPLEALVEDSNAGDNS